MDRTWRARCAWLVIGTVVLATGCGEATGPDTTNPDPSAGDSGLTEATEVIMDFGQTVAVGPVQVAFTGVLEDSRCPVDVTCVWAGNAAVELTVRADPGPAGALVLNTTREPRVREAAGLRFTLLEVRPAPRTSGVLQDEDYTVRIGVGPG